MHWVRRNAWLLASTGVIFFFLHLVLFSGLPSTETQKTIHPINPFLSNKRRPAPIEKDIQDVDRINNNNDNNNDNNNNNNNNQDLIARIKERIEIEERKNNEYKPEYDYDEKEKGTYQPEEREEEVVDNSEENEESEEIDEQDTNAVKDEVEVYLGESPVLGGIKKKRKNIVNSHLIPPKLSLGSVDPCKHASKGYFLYEWSNPTDALEQYDLFHMSALECMRQAKDIKENKIEAKEGVIYTAVSEMEMKNTIEKLEFLVYRTGSDGGFGNRARSLMSTLLAALLTGRILLLEWYVPTPWTTMMANPPGIDWDHQTFLKTYTNLYQGYNLSPSMVFTPTDANMGTDLREFMKGRVITITSTSPFFHAITRNNKYTNLIYDVLGPPAGGTPQTVGLREDKQKTFETVLLQHILYPSKPMQDLLQPFLNTFAHHYVIGIHVRTWEGCNDLRCIDPLLRCPLKILREKIFPKPLFFLAADRADLVHSMIEQLGENNTIIYDSEIVHYCDIKGNQGDKTIQSLAKLVADFWLLGEADLFFGTWYSSFSENAALRTSVPSYLLGKSEGDIWPTWCPS